MFSGSLKYFGNFTSVHLLLVLWVNVVVDRGAEPVALGVVEDGGDGVGDVDDPAGVAGHDKQEAVGGLEDEVLQLVVREEGGLVGAVVGRGVGDAAEGLDVSHRHPQNRQLVGLPGKGVASRHHV